jgi:hypothetical protein
MFFTSVIPGSVKKGTYKLKKTDKNENKTRKRSKKEKESIDLLKFKEGFTFTLKKINPRKNDKRKMSLIIIENSISLIETACLYHLSDNSSEPLRIKKNFTVTKMK